MNRKVIIERLEIERDRQDQLHPEWHGNYHGLSVLTEELGEVAQALNEDDIQNMKTELIQTMAVCCRWLENL